MVTTTISFNIAFPFSIASSASAVKSIPPELDTLLSFDCFIHNLKIELFESSEYLNKAFLFCFVPIFVWLAFILMFGIFKLIKKSSQFKANVTIAFITVVYFYHPSIVDKVIGLFKCDRIEEVARFYLDLEVVCWEGIHLKFVLFLAIPMILIWVIGFPVFGIIFLSMNQRKLDNP